MSNFRKLLVGGALAVPMLMTLPVTAGATTVESVDFKTLIHKADACVVGSVADTRTETVDGQVYTVTDFTVSDVAFGDVGGMVSVRTPGGAVTRSMFPVSEVVPGAPRFLSGQEYFLLLDDAPSLAPGYSAIGATDGFVPAGVFEGALPMIGGRVNLPGLGSGLDAESALDIVTEERAAPTAVVGETK